MHGHLDLASGFPAATGEQWRELARAIVGADDPESALTHRTYDGVELRPLYTAADAPAVSGNAGRADPAGWDVRQRHADPDPQRANQAVLSDLANGVTSLWLVIGATGIAPDHLATVLDSVHLDAIGIALDAGAASTQAADALLAVAEGRELSGTLGADPIGDAVRAGGEPSLRPLAGFAERTHAHRGLSSITVDGTACHDAGGGDADELAVATAAGVAYLRALTDAGLDIDTAVREIDFRLAVSDDQFAGIAKLRAFRRIWTRVISLAGAMPAASRLHAVTSAAMMTQRDPWVNMLRTTVACFAAAVGGADAITVAPFDSAIGLPDDLGRRVARNAQAILHDESALARVLDPAAGSWFAESVTEQLADLAWTRFLEIEREGGAVAALRSGLIRGWLSATRDARRDDIARRRVPITGVSAFPFLAEARVVRPAATGIPGERYAAPFEAFRDRADAYLARHGARPRVHLVGPAPTGTAALFQAGGFETPRSTVDGFSGGLACASSSELTAALRERGATRVWIAADLDPACDALAVLDEAWAAL